MPKVEVIRNHGVIAGVANLISKVRELRQDSPTGAVWLRGMDNEVYPLLPSIGREHKFAGQTTKFDRGTESSLLHRFRRYAYEFVGRELTLWEALFVARHHGLPVRLLDWTSSPLVALYFACEFRDFSNGKVPNGKIWMLIPGVSKANNPRVDVFKQEVDPVSIKGVRLVYPMVVAPRINAQSGFFTIQDDPWRSLDDYEKIELADEDLDIMQIVEFVVPGDKRAEWLQELNDQGMTRRTLFPDLDGLTAGLLSAQILRRDGGNPVSIK